MLDSKLTVALILLAVASLAFFLKSQSKSEAFQEWKKTFSPHGWSASEENYRRIIFERNLEIIKKHNEDLYQGYKMGINQFTVLTDQEFASIYLNPNPILTPVADVSMEVGADIDWVAKGMISPIKNQGQCGSCWAFSAIAQVQSFFREKGEKLSLSQQQLVDCSGSYGNHGCNGGSHTQGMKYVKDHGVVTESEYPYVGKTDPCKKQGGPHKVNTISSAKGCTGIQNALMTRPLGVGVDAGGWSKYSSGVFSSCGTALNHAVQLVGVTASYWKIKNSWGTSWGESGYIRLALGNTCGMCNSDASWAS